VRGKNCQRGGQVSLPLITFHDRRARVMPFERGGRAPPPPGSGSGMGFDFDREQD